MIILTYAIYRMATGYNITPWKWVARYLGIVAGTFFSIAFVLSMVVVASYPNPQNIMADKAFMERANDIAFKMLPFELLFQFGIFYLIRLRILKYVRTLDEMDRIQDIPTPPAPKKEDKDLSYFR